MIQFLMLLALSVSSDDIVRTWKTENGKFSVIATFRGVKGESVSLKKNDGTVINVDIGKLSTEDKRFIVGSTGWGRVWMDASGKHSTLADLVEFKNSTATLQLTSGAIIQVAYSKFSDADKLYLQARNASAQTKVDISKLKEVGGRVVGVTDGDTVTVLVKKTRVKIRLEGVDAPEQRQAFGNAAKKHVSSLCFGKPVTVKPSGKDKYGRTLGRVYVGGTSVSESLLANGFAWHYKKYSDDEVLSTLEERAKSAKVGLWAETNPIPPWEFRTSGTGARKQVFEGEKSGDEIRGPPTFSYWLNSSSGVRHNGSCRWFNNTKSGRPCNRYEGRGCGICGG